MTRLEELAWKHSTSAAQGLGFYFTIDQLDAYFNERLKIVAGGPVAWEAVGDKGLWREKSEGLDTPLYKLELDK